MGGDCSGKPGMRAARRNSGGEIRWIGAAEAAIFDAMALARERMIDRMLASDSAYDGRFLTGVLTTGIYCLPSCRARKPKPENVRFFDNPEAALQAGLRPCKRCRPDDFYSGTTRTRRSSRGWSSGSGASPPPSRGPRTSSGPPGSAPRSSTSCSGCTSTPPPPRSSPAPAWRPPSGCCWRPTARSPTSPSRWATRGSRRSTTNFRRLAAMSPAEYRRLLGASAFRIALPASYSMAPALEYLGRDDEEPDDPGPGAEPRDRRPAGRRARRAARRDRATARCAPRSGGARARCRCRTRRRGRTPTSSACSASTAIPARSSGGSPPSPAWRR